MEPVGFSIISTGRQSSANLGARNPSVYVTDATGVDGVIKTEAIFAPLAGSRRVES